MGLNRRPPPPWLDGAGRGSLSDPVRHAPSPLRLPPLLALALLAACGRDPAQLLTVSAARALPAGEQVTVEGQVTVAPGTFRSATGEEGFALQDDTGGLYVQLASRLDLTLGAHVRVRGTLAEVAQQRVLTSDAASVQRLEGTRERSPQDTRTGEVREATEGLLVRVTAPVTRPLEEDLPYGYTLAVNDGSGEVRVFVHASAGFELERLRALDVGQRLQVTGLSTQNQSTYEVSPRQPSDVVVR